MINSFNANIAIDYSVEVAIFLQQLAQWSYYNLAHNKHIHDGTVWTYNTVESFKKFFPYWSTQKIRTAIKKCLDEGLVQKGNFNKKGYDRTIWYAFTEKGRRYFPELDASETPESRDETHLLESTNAFVKINKAIPTINTTSKSFKKDINKKTLISKKAGASETMEILLANNVHEIPEQMLDDWMEVRSKRKAPVTITAWNRLNNTLCQIHQRFKISPIEAFETMVANAWQSLQLKYFEPKKSLSPLSQGRSNPNDNGSYNVITTWS